MDNFAMFEIFQDGYSNIYYFYRNKLVYVKYKQISSIYNLTKTILLLKNLALKNFYKNNNFNLLKILYNNKKFDFIHKYSSKIYKTRPKHIFNYRLKVQFIKLN